MPVRPRRSMLYMPGSNGRALDKARTLAADCLILDLEDSVSPESKQQARSQVVDSLEAGGYGHREIIVRTNSLDSPWAIDDFLSLAKSGTAPDGILIPKISSATEVCDAIVQIDAAGCHRDIGIWLMAETPRCILSIAEIASAHPRLRGLVLGTSDLAKETRVRHTPDRLGFIAALNLCVYAARANGLEVIDGVQLDLEDAVKGKTVQIDVPTMSHCDTCDGSGARKGTSPVTCTTCQGAGQVRMAQGFFSVQQTCPKCQGRGQMISDPCGDCHGQGVKEERKTLSVKIPAGVDTGDRIRLSGKGEAGPQGGPAGDLYVQMVVRDHPIFVRDDSNLHCEVPISFAQAALGGDLEVPTLSGKVKLKIPAETQSGKLFRLRGKGVAPVRGGGVGDLLCRVVLETPVNLSAKQREILQSFEDSLDGKRKHSPRSTNWFDGVKKFFDNLTG